MDRVWHGLPYTLSFLYVGTWRLFGYEGRFQVEWQKRAAADIPREALPTRLQRRE